MCLKSDIIHLCHFNIQSNLLFLQFYFRKMFSGNDDIFSMFSGGGGGGGHPFESLFGGQMMGGRSRRRKGKTFMVPHEVRELSFPA